MGTIETESKEHYSKITGKGLVVAHFNAPWCGPCKSQEPILEKVSEEYSVKLVNVNIENHKDIAIGLNVTSIPTLIFYSSGKIMNIMVGVQPESAINEVLDSLTTGRKNKTLNTVL